MTTKVALGALAVLSPFLVAVLKYSKPCLAPLAAVNPLLPLLCYTFLVVLCLLALAFLLLALALRR
jgi:hypothetical protein